jgi:isoquinoline 1-oxidoreductase beta subunit
MKASRRDFLRVAATTAGGLLVSVGRAQSTGAFQPNGFVRIDRDGTIAIWNKQPEIGQGILTALPMMAAELDADWARVKVEQGGLDTKRFGGQGSGGSDSIFSEGPEMRRAGAAARALLVQAAAQRWGVPESECSTERSTVAHQPSGRRIGYGELAGDAAKLTPPAKVALKRPDQFRLIGTRVPTVDSKAIVTGKAEYGIDVRRPGMLFASIEKCPVFAGRVRSVDDREARALPGVRDVIAIDGMDNLTHLMSGVAVLADTTWTAAEARKRLKVEWDEGSGAAESSAGLAARAAELLRGEGTTLAHVGDVEAALRGAAKVVEAEYEVPFLAHACMEPMNCVAEFRDGKVEIWGPMQMPMNARQLVSRKLGIPEPAVTIHLTRMGGGFGRRLMSDYAVEAAWLAQKTGRPVQVVATREDDIRHDYYRPRGFHRLRAGLDAKGRIVAWDHHLAGASRNAYRRDPRPAHLTEIYGMFTAASPELAKHIELQLLPVAIPNCRARFSELKTPVPTGAWRAPSHNALGFVIESFLDEVAVAAKRSPFEIRDEILGRAADFGGHGGYDPARMRNVLAIARERSGWGRKMPQGKGRGVACHFTFGSYAAEVAEVAVDSRGRVRVERVVAAVDCGIPINRAGVEAQTQGGVLDGVGMALYGRSTSTGAGQWRATSRTTACFDWPTRPRWRPIVWTAARGRPDSARSRCHRRPEPLRTPSSRPPASACGGFRSGFNSAWRYTVSTVMTEEEKEKAKAAAVAGAGATVGGVGGATAGVLELAARGLATGVSAGVVMGLGAAAGAGLAWGIYKYFKKQPRK